MFNGICRTIFRNTSKICYGTTRRISTSGQFKSYEDEGKTTLNILNNEEDACLMINGFSQVGFRLNNDMTVLGPMAIFPKSVVSWKITELDDISEESLSIFTVLEPKIDILVIGIGDKADDMTFYKRLLPFSKKYHINLEILATEQACSTFNFLNSEGRYVAGVFIPPQIIEPTDNDVVQSKLRYQNLYEID